MIDNGLLTVRELSSYLKASLCTVYRMVEGKEIPFARIRFGVRFRREEVDEWITRNSFMPSLFLESNLNSDPALKNHVKIYPKGGRERVAKKATRHNYGYGKTYPRRTKSGEIRWYLDFKNAEGRRVRRVVENASSQNDAQLVLKKEIADVFLKRNPEITRREEVNFESFAVSYLESYIKVNRRNWKSDAYRLQKLTRFFRGFTLRQITPLRIEEMKSQRLRAGNSNSTINRYLALLKRMFGLAIQEGYCEENPVKKVKLYSERDCIKERILTVDEEKRLLAESSQNLRPVIQVGLNTGMRLGEILSMKWSRIDFRKKTLCIEKTKAGKVLMLPMNETLTSLLLGLKRTRGREEKVFPIKSIRTAFENARKRAGLPDVTFHSLRHTAACRMLDRGADVITVQNLLGHSSVTVTQRYLHAQDENKRKAIDSLCENQEDLAEKSNNLAHGWHTGLPEELRKILTSSFSRN